MNEKYMLFILIVLTIITNSKYTVASPTIRHVNSNTYDIEDTIAYWTPERMRNAKPFDNDKRIGVKNKKKIQDGKKVGVPGKALNLTDVNGVFPVGKLFVHDPSTNSDYLCTASVMNSDNGNIGLTAAHCVFKYPNIWFTNVKFCPENGECVPVKASNLNMNENENDFVSDYAMMKFSGDGRLQDKTGYFNWDATAGDDVAVTIFGYPGDGEMQCAKNSKVLCMWQGDSYLDGDVRAVSVFTGHGTSGGPWVKQYDPNTKSGWIIADTSQGAVQYTDSPIYAYDDFFNLLQATEKM